MTNALYGECPCKERRLTEIYREEKLMMTETERLEKCSYKPGIASQQPPEVRRTAYNKFSFRASGRTQSCQHLDFRLLTLGIVGE